MVEYLKEIAARLQVAADAHAPGGGQRRNPGAPPPNAVELLKAFCEEVDRLDPRDFDPDVRAQFVELRANVRHIAAARETSDNLRALCANKILPVLSAYRGEGSRAITEELLFVSDPQVREIVKRDYKELKVKTYPDAAWKSTVVLAGGILEAILYDQLTKDVATIARAMASGDAPKKGPRGARVTKVITSTRYEDQWTFADMIKVAADIGIISQSNEDSIDEVLREYRNYVHARVEIQKGVPITEGHAMAAMGCLQVIIEKLR